VKAKRTRVLLCKSLNSFRKQRPKVTRKPIHLGNPGVVLAGDYNNPEDWVMPVRIIEEHVTPELHRRLGK
jgi:hypothetical protein